MTALPKSPAMLLYSYIYNNILLKEYDRLIKKGDKLGEQNFNLGANSRGFVYKGQILSHSRGSGGPAATPHESLKGELEDLFTARTKFARDRDFIRQVCSFIIPDEYDPQNMRDALSDMIVEYIPQLKNIPRLREEAYYVANSEAQYKQWLKAKERIEYYIGNMLVFS